MLKNSDFTINLSSRMIVLFVNQISSIAMLYFMISRLDINQFGIISSALIIYNIVFIIIEWGFTIYSINSLKFLNHSEQEKKISAILWAKIIFFCFSILIIIYFFKKNIILYEDYYLLISLIFLILVSVFNPLWLLQFLNKTELLLIPTIFFKILQFFIVYFFLKNEYSFLIVLSQAVSFFFISLCAYIYIIKKFDFFKIARFSEIINVIKSSKSIFFNTLNQNFSHSLWGIYLIFFGNNIHVSVFNLADTFFRAGNSLTSIFPEVLLGTYKKKVDFKKIYLLIFLVILISISLFISAEYFIINYLDQIFVDNMIFFYITIFSWFVISIIKIIAYPFFFKKKNLRFLNLVSFLTIFAHFSSILLFIIFFAKINLNYISSTYLFISLSSLLVFLTKLKKIN